MTGFPGFDKSDYPGDAVMAWLRSNTNLAWCGYYLARAPNHNDTSWMGRRASLVAAHWGLAPLYVGQQTKTDPDKLSAAQGQLDAVEACKLMSDEGFAPGSFVYLDLENGPPLAQPQRDYVAAWCDAVEAGTFAAGIYCSHLLAAAAHQLRPSARIWAFKVETTQPHPVPGTQFPTLDPAGCGYAGAFIWQLGQECQITLPGAPHGILQVDLDVAVNAAPAAPLPAVPALVG